MTGTATGLGTFSWVDRTGGQLSAAERRSLLRPLAQGLAVNAAGRLLMLVKLNSGRRAQVGRTLAAGGLPVSVGLPGAVGDPVGAAAGWTRIFTVVPWAAVV